MYVDPTYKTIQETLKEEEEFNHALDKSKELQEVRDKLLSKYNTLSEEELNRLSKLLPDHVDNVRLILDIDRMASAYGMRIKNVVIGNKEENGKLAIGPDTIAYQSVLLSFSIASSYDTLKDFIRDLEKSLRIVDITDISLASSKSILEENDLYEYNISLKTYWLKN